jgi:hypothetical protein
VPERCHRAAIAPAQAIGRVQVIVPELATDLELAIVLAPVTDLAPATDRAICRRTARALAIDQATDPVIVPALAKVRSPATDPTELRIAASVRHSVKIVARRFRTNSATTIRAGISGATIRTGPAGG